LEETTVFILRMAATQILPPVGVRIEALSASGRGPYSSSGVTCDATHWQESRRLSLSCFRQHSGKTSHSITFVGAQEDSAIVMDREDSHGACRDQELGTGHRTPILEPVRIAPILPDPYRHGSS